MRELKFRAWMKSENRMIQWEELCDVKADILSDVLNRVYLHDVMQYTGRKDKNGVEIYEGDVIRYGWFAYNDAQTYGEEPYDNLPEDVDPNAISRIIEPAFVVNWSWKELENLRQMIEGNPDVFGVEVIGNVYEHPELLEGE